MFNALKRTWRIWLLPLLIFLAAVALVIIGVFDEPSSLSDLHLR